MSINWNVSTAVEFPCLTMWYRLFGDQVEIDFWTVAVYYLSREQARMKDPSYKVCTWSLIDYCHTPHSLLNTFDWHVDLVRIMCKDIIRHLQNSSASK